MVRSIRQFNTHSTRVFDMNGRFQNRKVAEPGYRASVSKWTGRSFLGVGMVLLAQCGGENKPTPEPIPQALTTFIDASRLVSKPESFELVLSFKDKSGLRGLTEEQTLVFLRSIPDQ